MAQKTGDTVKTQRVTIVSINPPPSSTSSAPVPHSFQESPWRQVDWSEETKEVLMESVRSYKPACDSVAAARVLLVGPVGAGKSSFISSVQSMFYGRVVNRAMVGSSSSSSTSFTKQLQSFQLYGSRERDGKNIALVLSDMAGLGETNSPTLHDMLATIKGHVPEGHTDPKVVPKLTLEKVKLERMSPEGEGAGAEGGGGGSGLPPDAKAPRKRPSAVESPKSSVKKQKKGGSDGPKSSEDEASSKSEQSAPSSPTSPFSPSNYILYSTTSSDSDFEPVQKQGQGEPQGPLHSMVEDLQSEESDDDHSTGAEVEFSACSPVGSDTPGYVKEPHLAEKVHCVAFVISSLELSSYSQTMTSTFQQLREHISALGVHQVALLTHVDKLGLASDITQVYRSLPLKHAMMKAGDLLGLPVSSIVPVKNYSEELELEPHTDTLLLKALDHILQYVELHFRDHPQGPQQADDANSTTSSLEN
ncbi:interferon-induced protein 44-like isoform X2 [Clupea harengus]|nr:interferon-induced protein 44-like isoform X2 [Clupea harengus]XP_031430164.1 interferon-induced protein 44-like isoform X2 [Clupea harengus]